MQMLANFSNLTNHLENLNARNFYNNIYNIKCIFNILYICIKKRLIELSSLLTAKQTFVIR